MASMPTPMLPPDIREQAPPQEMPSPVYMQAGQGAMQAQGGGDVGGDPLGQLEQLIQAMEKNVGDIAQLLSQVHPPSQAFLVPIAQAGKALQKRIQELRQQMSGRSGTPPPPAPNPSEVPSGRPPA